jgi:CheY-like chemotaxis protein
MILIVDDEPDIRDSLVEFFADEGLPVRSAADGGAALASLERGELPWVIILDLLMPVLDGNQLYERMQANPRWSRVPVIVSTSAPERAPVGATVVRKPVNLTRLLKMVRRHCPTSA